MTVLLMMTRQIDGKEMNNQSVGMVIGIEATCVIVAAKRAGIYISVPTGHGRFTLAGWSTDRIWTREADRMIAPISKTTPK